MRKREEEVKQSLSSSLRERDKEREQHKKDEAVQLFNALLADLVSTVFRPLDKSTYLKDIFVNSQPKHMLWVLKRTVSMRLLF